MTEQKPAEAVPAATMLLVRDEPEFQVLMVKRHHQIDFASGALVFPGGKPHSDDSLEEWATVLGSMVKLLTSSFIGTVRIFGPDSLEE